MPVDEHQVSNVNDETCTLSDDEDRVTTMNRVDRGHDSAGQREVPEDDGNVAGLFTLGRDPLDDEARAEEELPAESERDPEVPASRIESHYEPSSLAR